MCVMDIAVTLAVPLHLRYSVNISSSKKKKKEGEEEWNIFIWGLNAAFGA